MVGKVHILRDVGEAIAVGDHDRAVHRDSSDPEEAEVHDSDVESGGDMSCSLHRVVAVGLAAQGACGRRRHDGVAFGAGRGSDRHGCRGGSRAVPGGGHRGDTRPDWDVGAAPGGTGAGPGGAGVVGGPRGIGGEAGGAPLVEGAPKGAGPAEPPPETLPHRPCWRYPIMRSPPPAVGPPAGRSVVVSVLSQVPTRTGAVVLGSQTVAAGLSGLPSPRWSGLRSTADRSRCSSSTVFPELRHLWAMTWQKSTAMTANSGCQRTRARTC